ncbi:MAG TPA: hypothetical protein VHC40_13240 [Rhizomicrobium sp.]|jgi:hypothetical protein|nr:hypothetical protein [Rhizomicrobium sp.]
MVCRSVRLGAGFLLALAAAGCASPPPPPQQAPSASAIPAPPPRGAPSPYLNLSGAALRAAFGQPAFVRKDGVTEMWRYDGAACRAFFFLYGAQPAVRHVETLPHGTDSPADAACLTALRAAPRAATPKTS